MIFHPVCAVLQQNPEFIRSKFLQILVRVLRIPHLQNLHLEPRLFKHGDGPLGGILPRLVAVINQDDLLCIPAQQKGMLFRQGRTQGRNRTVKAVLVQGNGIHIPLHQDHITQFCLFCNVQSKQIFPLVENHGLRRIQVLWLRIIHDPAAKPDHIAANINNRKHQAVPEPVIGAFVFFRGHTSRKQLLFRVPLRLHGITQISPAGRSKADAEPGQSYLRHTSFLGICQSLPSGRTVELLDKKARGFLIECPEPFLALVHGPILLVVRHLHPRPLGQGPDGIGVAQTLDLHFEIDDAAALVAAEAVENALVRSDRKGGGFLSVEGTQAKEIAARPLQIHILAHNLFNRIPGRQLVQKLRWKWQM